ncbi:phytanoyl-CoA dioxygenase [Halothiobacillus diazotrophicus]|uniref:Phytanoyl-CoA dioxygenase n=1 Tax=Halothiobacillus diazotrophicus TaxID=1860122 RepID=A0A191ZIN0_9GAMM|nr:phytanoyl-CoA dioxygenase family protein [Halothiobacillus diazotrophicus]ANJ67713.1 phytanoyl-CoA dioxygenase [Halothiobacillus diazotrophicus]
MNEILSSEQIEIFHRDGVVVIPNFYNMDKITPIQKGIYDIIGQIITREEISLKQSPFNPDTFDQHYIDLIGINRDWGGEIYDAVKQIPAFIRLVADESHEKLFKQIRCTRKPGIAGGGYGIRIDNPNEDKFRAMWHQEYPAQLRSVDGLVFWSPLVPITEEIGPVEFCPGSHHEGPLPVCYADPEHTGRTGAYSLKILDEAVHLNKYRKIAPLTSPGDLVIIDFLVLHASGVNRSHRARWSMQFRYFNFEDPIGRKHGWKGSFAAGTDFRKIHPELFAEKPLQ